MIASLTICQTRILQAKVGWETTFASDVLDLNRERYLFLTRVYTWSKNAVSYNKSTVSSQFSLWCRNHRQTRQKMGFRYYKEKLEGSIMLARRMAEEGSKAITLCLVV